MAKEALHPFSLPAVIFKTTVMKEYKKENLELAPISHYRDKSNVVKAKVVRASDSSRIQIEFTNEKGEKVKDYVKKS